jgi:hypothetical protein
VETQFVASQNAPNRDPLHKVVKSMVSQCKTSGHTTPDCPRPPAPHLVLSEGDRHALTAADDLQADRQAVGIVEHNGMAVAGRTIASIGRQQGGAG